MPRKVVAVLRRELAVTPLALLAASAVLLTVSGRETGAARTVPTPGDPHAIEPLTTSASTGQAPSPFAVRERVLASIVGVRATLAQPQLKFTGKRRIVAEVTPSKGTGSGIVVDSAGLILTCAHVIGGAGKVRVFLADDREVEGTVTVYDTTSDLALLRVDAGPLPALDVHTGGALREEQAVFLGARPGGAELRFFARPSRRSVRAAAKVNVSTGSNTLLYCNGRVPSPAGYGARGFSGYSSRSSTQRLLKPSSSARRATRVIASGPATAPICGKANPIRTRPPYLTEPSTPRRML